MTNFKSIVLSLLLFFQISHSIGQSINYTIHKDGSFDIKGKTVSILNAYPAFDSKPLKVLSVKIEETRGYKSVIYNLAVGKLILKFDYADSALRIHPSVEGLKYIPEYISVLSNAEVTGADKVYKTPVIISGKGGVLPWPSKELKGLKCESITGLIPDKGNTLVVATYDYKKYITSTVLAPTEKNHGKKLLDFVIETEKVAYNNLPILHFTQNPSAYEAMRNQAQAAAKFMGAKNRKPQSYHWCSWYYTYYHLTQQMVSDYLKGFKETNLSPNIQTFQIDAGYHPHVGDWLEPSSRFPNGLSPSVKEIISNGYRAGIWIGPYMVGNRSKLYAEHPDWLLRRNDGKPITQMTFYGEERLWGVMDEEIYVLDTSNPAVMDYLRSVFRQLKQMGIRFYKTDFMYYGWEGSQNVKRFSPGKTSSEYQRELFDMIRQEIGEESYWLGCIAPFPVMLGYVDGMRVAGDISPKWEATLDMFFETKADQHINNIWWQNDPDALLLREKYNKLTEEETKTIVYWVGMLGGVINTSDLFHEIPKQRLELWRFIEPGSKSYTCLFPFIDKKEKLEVLTRSYPERKSFAVLVANLTNEKISSSYSLSSLVGIEKATCFNWNVEKNENLGVQNVVAVDLAPH
ncbi:MAG TPA: glycoside hydrolase family 36 protein, partial [Pedobacter sp.]